ncbi:MAG: molybdopterin-dependent oxidoreductase [Hyphomicrobiales bacterium]|nr:molybdopterin-dependent oxidoreductase [Hyphomicrobiales bacterium]
MNKYMNGDTARSGNAGQVTVPGICGICPAGCGVNVHFENNVIKRLTPLKGHPLGFVCPRGAHAAEIVYSPDRLLYPQRRCGERGENKFERISWDDAYEILVENLQKIANRHGPEAVCLSTGRGNFEYGLCESFAPSNTSESSANGVLFPFGSPNTTSVGALCYVSYGMIAPEACFGLHIKELYEDLENADLIIVWGGNPATDSPPINLRRLKKAKSRGARIIVIDHRRSETVKALGAQWLGVRPGTDGALALAAINVLIAEDLLDHNFIKNWTHGFPELKQYVSQYTPQRAAAITGVKASAIIDLARSMGVARGCSVLMYTGLEYSNSGIQAIRAIWTLQALAGHLDVPGGKCFRMPQRTQVNGRNTKPPVNARPAFGAEEYPLYHAVRSEAHGGALPRAILENEPYPLRGMILSGTSVITAWPDPATWRKALASLDFLAVVNRFPTADAAYADLLLPAATPFECESYMIYDGYIQHRARMIEPLGEARNDYLIFAELAARLGYGDLWPQTEAAMVEAALEGTGFTLDELRNHPCGISFALPDGGYRKYQRGHLRADGKPGFATPTGKFEITSEWLREHRFDTLPVYTEPSEGPLTTPELARRYPLVFNSGARTQSAFRSQHHNIPSLVAKQPKPLVHLHCDDAKARNIIDGDKVYVETPRGRILFWARVSEDIVRGAIEVNMGGGGPLGPDAWQHSNVNELTDPNNIDIVSGFPVYKALLAEVVLALD